MALLPTKKTEPPKDKVLGTATWLGEGEDGPKVNEWNGIKFKVGEAVDITSPHMMAKAMNNRFYDAVEFEPKPAEPRQQYPGRQIGLDPGRQTGPDPAGYRTDAAGNLKPVEPV